MPPPALSTTFTLPRLTLYVLSQYMREANIDPRRTHVGMPDRADSTGHSAPAAASTAAARTPSLIPMRDDHGNGQQRPKPVADEADETSDGAVTAPAEPIASDRDRTGLPIHRGWAPLGGRRRWMEPFVLVLLAEGPAHGYALVGQLEEMGTSSGELDFGAVYRTLRDLEASGQVTSTWSTDAVGPQRREYALTDSGYAALDEWSAVMRERGRLVAEFDARYLAAVAVRRAATKRR